MVILFRGALGAVSRIQGLVRVAPERLLQGGRTTILGYGRELPSHMAGLRWVCVVITIAGLISQACSMFRIILVLNMVICLTFNC